MVMEPSREGLSLPGEIGFTLENRTDSRFDTNFYRAGLSKFVDGEWFWVAPQAVPQPLTPLPAGESHTWTVSMSGDLPEPTAVPSKPLSRNVTARATTTHGPTTASRETSERTVGGLGGGRYAFGIDGWFQGGSYDRKTAFAAIVEVRGAPVELTTTDAIENVTVNGDVLTARWTSGGGEHAHRATYVLERTNKPPDSHLITEQIVQEGTGDNDLLRDALALATDRGVHEVRLTGQTASVPPFGVQERVIEYKGKTYAISARETSTQTGA